MKLLLNKFKEEGLVKQSEVYLLTDSLMKQVNLERLCKQSLIHLMSKDRLIKELNLERLLKQSLIHLLT